jgi:hypothetical protein
MTKTEASKILDVPLSTLNDWKKSDSNRHTLYKFIIASDKNEVVSKLNNKKSHRIFHILNRNINATFNYTFNDIEKAFSKNNYNKATNRECIIYSKFFKECDVNDLASLISIFGVSIRTIKQLYLTLPERKIIGVAKVWDKRFRVKHLIFEQKRTNKVPSALQHILKKRELV